jgi:hypothetical protein
MQSKGRCELLGSLHIDLVLLCQKICALFLALKRTDVSFGARALPVLARSTLPVLVPSPADVSAPLLACPIAG